MPNLRKEPTLGPFVLAVILAAAGCNNNASRIQALEQEVARLRQQQAAGQAAPRVPVATWRPIKGGALLSLDGSALFYPGQARLKDSGVKLLTQVASDIRAGFANKTIFVLGHTDNDPIKKTTWLDNRELSAARAVAVVRVLESNGVPPGLLIAGGCGEHRPLAANDTPDARARNRRVEIVAADALLAPSRPHP